MARSYYQDSPTEGERKAFTKYLAEDEELILATGFGKTYMRSKFIIYIGWPGTIFIGLGWGLSTLLNFNPGYGLLAGLFFASIFAWVKAAWAYHANRYLLTTRRVIIKKGLFAVQLTSALYDKITHIEVDQSFFDKTVMHHGNIIINTAGMNKGEIALKFVEHPIEFKNLLERLINREREQYGLRPAPMVTVEGEVV